MKTHPFDVDKDGNLTAEEVKRAREIQDIFIDQQKAASQKKMAWVAMWSMLIFTVGLFTPLVAVERVDALADLLGLFYIAQAGVVGAYMGVTAWMSMRNKPSNPYDIYSSRHSDYRDRE